MAKKQETRRTTHEKMAQETREKLITAAREAFVKNGYSATSMDDFTASVGLTRGALYHHFGNKKGLFAAVVRQVDAEIDQELLEISDNEADAWQGLYLRGIAYLKMALNIEIQQLLLKDAKSVLGEALSSIQMQCLDSVAQLLERGMVEHRIIQADPQALSVLINGSLTEAAFWIASAEASDEDPQKRLDDSLHCWWILMKGIQK